jgi:hypothetical protein
MSSQLHALAIFLSAEHLPFIHLREGQVGSRVGLDGMGGNINLAAKCLWADSRVNWFK